MAAAAAGAGVGVGDYDLPLEEVDAVLASFSGEPAAVFAPLPLPAPALGAEAGASREPVSAGESLREGLGEVERFLMEDYVDEAAVDRVDEFLDGVLVGDGEDDGSPKNTGKRSADGAYAGEDDESVGVDGDDDPDSKKRRRRQMRNRDSAMKSRERKKLYVKDLEMKSKHLEAECCRLSYALQCCAAENMALRQCLLKDRPVGAPTAMQESAVLTETLPLVSLLWLMSILCLFLMPGAPNRNLVAPSSLERDLVKLATISTDGVKLATISTDGVKLATISTDGVKMTRATTNHDDPRTLELVRLGRSYRGTRARIKSPWLPWHAVAAR